jgi:hypothetical protein
VLTPITPCISTSEITMNIHPKVYFRNFICPQFLRHCCDNRLRVRRPQASSIISSNLHILAVLSALAVARCFPLGQKAISLTEPSYSILSIVSQKGADRALIAISRGRLYLRRSKRYATTFCIGPQLKLWIQTLTALPVIRFSQKYS